MRPNTVLAALATALALTACGSGGSAAPPPATSTSAGYQSACHEDGDRELTLPGPDGGSVFTVTVGKGRRAIVLIHQAGDDHCQWMATARVLAMSGVQVWAMDSSGGSGLTHPKEAFLTVALDEEVDPVVAAARKNGATEIVLAGASMGGTLAIAAAGRDHAVRVASLSGPGFYNGADALGAISTLNIPVLLVAADGDSDFALSARQLAAAGPKGLVTHLEIGGTAHGVGTLSGSYLGKSIDDTFTQFVLGR
jgi:pimeloyl-ACP methyl ester carboxylesterase